MSEEARLQLKNWMLSDEHFSNPYPTAHEFEILSRRTGLSTAQIRNWFVNARIRIWKPLVASQNSEQEAVEQELTSVAKEENELVPTFEDTPTEWPTYEGRRKDSRSYSMPCLTPYQDDGHQYQEGIHKKRKVSSQVDYIKSTRRKGCWTREEEAYANTLVKFFNQGLVEDAEEGTTLRGYLANRLNCDPMRISKKFSRTARLGKMIFSSTVNTKTPSEIAAVRHELSTVLSNYNYSLYRTTIYYNPLDSLEHHSRFPMAPSPVAPMYPTPYPQYALGSMNRNCYQNNNDLLAWEPLPVHDAMHAMHTNIDFSCVAHVLNSTPTSSLDATLEDVRRIERQYDSYSPASTNYTPSQNCIISYTK